VSQLDLRLIVALLTVNLAGYAAGYGGGRMMGLPQTMRRALTLEIGMQNAGLGTTLAMGLFADERIALPAALYTFGCMFTGTILARVWAEWSERRTVVAEDVEEAR
jgi:BASS family bile acid:Na+ symporter